MQSVVLGGFAVDLIGFSDGNIIVHIDLRISGSDNFFSHPGKGYCVCIDGGNLVSMMFL